MIDGYLVELTFIHYFNNSKYKELNPIAQDLIKELYPFVKDNDKIIAYKYGKYAKVDVVIMIRGIKKGLSIKTGSKNSVHLEKVNSFIFFLKKNGFKKEEQLKRYIYSDGTSDNTGKVRISSEEYKVNNEDSIKEINEELKDIKEKLIRRFLIKADINYKVTVDAIIYGFVNDFLWATKQEIINYLRKKEIDSTGVHISSLFIQNWDKNLKRNEKYEYCREYIQVKWYSLFDDFIGIMNERVEPQVLNAQADSVKHKKKNSVITKFLNNIWSG